MRKKDEFFLMTWKSLYHVTQLLQQSSEGWEPQGTHSPPGGLKNI